MQFLPHILQNNLRLSPAMDLSRRQSTIRSQAEERFLEQQLSLQPEDLAKHRFIACLLDIVIFPAQVWTVISLPARFPLAEL